RKRCPQRLQPRFVVTPLLERISEYGQAHLLGARRAHRPRILVKAQAGFLEWQSAIAEQPANFTFDVFDQPLVENTVDEARQHGVEMRHQRHIVAVVAGDVLKIVAESLSAREMLLEQ